MSTCPNIASNPTAVERQKIKISFACMPKAIIQGSLTKNRPFENKTFPSELYEAWKIPFEKYCAQRRWCSQHKRESRGGRERQTCDDKVICSGNWTTESRHNFLTQTQTFKHAGSACSCMKSWILLEKFFSFPVQMEKKKNMIFPGRWKC